MRCSVVTAVKNGMPHLPRCIASVADQTGVEVEHIVRDGASTDGSAEWLMARPSVRAVSGPDAGLYDALNKGFAAATGDIFSWLNADEQYLPGALAAAADWFERHPETDLLFGDFILVDEGGMPKAYRPAMPARRAFLGASYLYNFSCAMFFRAGLWRTLGGFDPSFRIAGDEDFVLRAMAAGARAGILSKPLAIFAYGRGNLTNRAEAAREHEQIKKKLPSWIRHARIPLNVLRLAEKALRGGGRARGPVTYAAYIRSTEARTEFRADRISARWPDYPWPYLHHYRRNAPDADSEK